MGANGVPQGEKVFPGIKLILFPGKVFPSGKVPGGNGKGSHFPRQLTAPWVSGAIFYPKFWGAVAINFPSGGGKPFGVPPRVPRMEFYGKGPNSKFVENFSRNWFREFREIFLLGTGPELGTGKKKNQKIPIPVGFLAQTPQKKKPPFSRGKTFSIGGFPPGERNFSGIKKKFRRPKRGGPFLPLFQFPVKKTERALIIREFLGRGLRKKFQWGPGFGFGENLSQKNGSPVKGAPLLSKRALKGVGGGKGASGGK